MAGTHEKISSDTEKTKSVTATRSLIPKSVTKTDATDRSKVRRDELNNKELKSISVARADNCEESVSVADLDKN